MGKLQRKSRCDYRRHPRYRPRNGKSLRHWEGAYVFITGRRQKELEEAVASIRQQRHRRFKATSRLGRPRSSLRERQSEGPD